MVLPRPTLAWHQTRYLASTSTLPAALAHTGCTERQQGLLGWHGQERGKPTTTLIKAWSLQQVHCMLSWGWAGMGRAAQGAESHRDTGPSQQPCTNQGPRSQSHPSKGQHQACYPLCSPHCNGDQALLFFHTCNIKHPSKYRRCAKKKM